MSLLCCSAAACGKKENKDTKPSTNTENRTDVEERMENTGDTIRENAENTKENIKENTQRMEDTMRENQDSNNATNSGNGAGNE